MRSNVINVKFVKIFEEYQFKCVIQGLDKSLNKRFGNSESLLKKNHTKIFSWHSQCEAFSVTSEANSWANDSYELFFNESETHSMACEVQLSSKLFLGSV